MGLAEEEDDDGGGGSPGPYDDKDGEDHQDSDLSDHWVFAGVVFGARCVHFGVSRMSTQRISMAMMAVATETAPMTNVTPAINVILSSLLRESMRVLTLSICAAISARSLSFCTVISVRNWSTL